MEISGTNRRIIVNNNINESVNSEHVESASLTLRNQKVQHNLPQNPNKINLIAISENPNPCYTSQSARRRTAPLEALSSKRYNLKDSVISQQP